MNSHYVPGTTVGDGDKVMDKTDNNLFPNRAHIFIEKIANKKIDT